MATVAVEGGQWVFPGDILANVSSATGGVGVYVDESSGDIRSALHGRVLIEELSSSSSSSSSGKRGAGAAAVRLNVVVRPEDFGLKKKIVARDLVPRVGDIVLARILRTNYNQAYVDVLCLGDESLAAPVKAVIRREDIRETEVDKVVVQDFFKPFDVVRAVVISLGDNKHYFLSTANKSVDGGESSLLGVVLPNPRSADI
jgi:exosome complex component CSL4